MTRPALTTGGPEQGSGDTDMTTREQQLTEAFVALSDTLADDVDPLTLLDRLVRHSVALTSIDAAGIMLLNARGQLRPAVATEHTVELTEMWQAQILQGPCVDAYVSGIAVHAIDLPAHHERWPQFVPLAAAAGYESAHALPLLACGRPIGALNLLARHPTALDGTETRLLRALTDVTTTALMTWDRDPPRPDDITTRTQTALAGKAVFDTATGMLAATAAITPHQAGLRLIAHAERHHRRPTDLADDLVQRRITPDSILNKK
ncbi:GAF and ANTAR domain-containing protein [Streptomyces sp. NPDC054904]